MAQRTEKQRGGPSQVRNTHSTRSPALWAGARARRSSPFLSRPLGRPVAVHPPPPAAAWSATAADLSNSASLIRPPTCHVKAKCVGPTFIPFLTHFNVGTEYLFIHCSIPRL